MPSNRYEWGVIVVSLVAALFIWSITPSREALPKMNQSPGERVFQQYCAGCHTRGSSTCPRLEELADRPLIAGRLDNTPDNLRLWIRDPRAIKPGTSMPTFPLTEQQLDDLVEWILSTY